MTFISPVRPLQILLWAVIFGALPGFAATNYYVSTMGNDLNAGTLAAPFRHIQKACDVVSPGDNIFVRGGVFNERVTMQKSGAGGNYITVQNYPDEVAIVDGTALVAPTYESALFYIENQSYIIVKGLELRNYTTTKSSAVPAGIYLVGTSHHIELRNNRIHHIENTYNSAAANALGIGIYGTSGAASLNNVIIDGNEVYNLKTGSSESLVLNGNVEQFEVAHNQVHDNNNIGIDFIGFEGTCPSSSLDRARNGTCHDNKIWNIHTTGNPAYRTGTNKYDPSAGGLYVDGGAQIVMERNEIFGCDIGLEVSSEHASRYADSITVRDNLIYRNSTEGLAVGGYDNTVGYTLNCAFTNNTLYQNDVTNSGSGELLMQYKVTNCTFQNNIFVAGASNNLIINPFAQNTGNVFDYNLFFAPGGAIGSHWLWKNADKTGFDVYRNFSGNDAHSLFADPQFINSTANDFHLQAASPAVNAGNPSFTAATGETDFGGNTRVLNGRVDIGALEAGSAAPPSLSINDVSITEGNSDTKILNFIVTLSAPATQAITVQFATANASATADSDYLSASGKLSFAPGESSKVIPVVIKGDLLNEADEKFYVVLSNPAGATIARGRGVGTILNDDRAPALKIDDVSITEGNSSTTNLIFTVSLSAPSGRSISVNFATADGTALSSSDYVAQSGTLIFDAGQTSKTIAVAVNGDTVLEGDEAFYVLLTNPLRASIGKARGIGTIVNDDASS